MANVHDYLRWRGDLTFAERPFNDADNIVLSILAYLDFTGIVPDEFQGGSVALGDACRSLIERGGGDVAPFVASLLHIGTDLVELVADSRRFCDARVSAYANATDVEVALQFSAVRFELPDVGMYVAFRGTDSTLVGWREDFMLSFEVTQAQRAAANYLNQSLRRAAFTNTPVLVGGHSKGGNLAEYAALCCDESLRGLVERVYSNDGPGMAPEVMSGDGRALLGNKFRRIVPAYSVVGMLFARPTDSCKVVASTASGIGQHDLTTWKLNRDGVEEKPALQPDCVVLNEAIAQWTKGLSLDERKRITNEVFDALGAGGATRFDQIASRPDRLQKVLRSLMDTDERTREVALALLQGTIDSSMGAVRKAARKAFEDATRRFAD